MIRKKRKENDLRWDHEDGVSLARCPNTNSCFEPNHAFAHTTRRWASVGSKDWSITPTLTKYNSGHIWCYLPWSEVHSPPKEIILFCSRQICRMAVTLNTHLYIFSSRLRAPLLGFEQIQHAKENVRFKMFSWSACCVQETQAESGLNDIYWIISRWSYFREGGFISPSYSDKKLRVFRRTHQ